MGSLDYNKMGLVLEGGGMRGVFTCGVLDYFLDKKIYFPYSIAVSAGSCHALSYLSRQRGRSRKSSIELLDTHHYIGFRNLILKRKFIDYDILFRLFPEEISPYDYATNFESPHRLVMVTTNCLTGKAEYMEEKQDKERLIAICKASSSLPFVSQITYVDGIPMIDGGLADSIPVLRAISEGYDKYVVVLTRNKEYRKRKKDLPCPSFVYSQYPLLRETIDKRNLLYNEQLDLIDKLEEEGKIIVIRPVKPMDVDRMETNVAKLEKLYDEGYRCAQNIFDHLT